MTNWKISINFAAILGVVLVIWCCVHSDPVMRYIGVQEPSICAEAGIDDPRAAR